MGEEPPINRGQKSQILTPRKKYDFLGVFYCLPVALICAILSFLLAAIPLWIVTPPRLGFGLEEELSDWLMGQAHAAIIAGWAGAIGGAIGGMTRRRKMAMVVGSFVSLASAVLWAIPVLSNTTKRVDEWDMLAISIGLAWAGLFCAVGGFLGQWLNKEGQWLNKEDR
jgi:hypothetical protein